MSNSAPTYDLVLLLDPQAEEDVRSKVIADVLEAISAGGELVKHDRWGDRALAYQIDHKSTAEYHLFQFHPALTELLQPLIRSLHIADGVIRFRINKLKSGTPNAPDMSAPRRAEAEPASAHA
jgi:small subunit ribosomal protein S6